MTSTETGSVPRTEFAHNFDFEHQVLRDFGSNSQVPSSTERDDSSSLELQRYTQLGHEREAVAMALVAVSASEDRDAEVSVKVCNARKLIIALGNPAYEQILTAGFCY